MMLFHILSAVADDNGLNWLRNFSALTGSGATGLVLGALIRGWLRHPRELEAIEKQLVEKEADINELKGELKEAREQVLRLLTSTERAVALSAASVETTKQTVEAVRRTT